MSKEKRQLISSEWNCLYSRKQLCHVIMYVLLVAASGVRWEVTDFKHGETHTHSSKLERWFCPQIAQYWLLPAILYSKHGKRFNRSCALCYFVVSCRQVSHRSARTVELSADRVTTIFSWKKDILSLTILRLYMMLLKQERNKKCCERRLCGEPLRGVLTRAWKDGRVDSSTYFSLLHGYPEDQTTSTPSKVA